MNALLELAELESGDVELETSEISVQDVFDELRQEFQFQAEAKNLQLEVRGEPRMVFGDPHGAAYSAEVATSAVKAGQYPLQ